MKLDSHESTRRWTSFAIAIVAAMSIFILMILMWLNRIDPVITHMILKNFKVIIGIPLSAAVAFIVIVFFRQSEKTITVKVPGFELNGSSGEIVLWILTFGAISMMIHLLWMPM